MVNAMECACGETEDDKERRLGLPRSLTYLVERQNALLCLEAYIELCSSCLDHLDVWAYPDMSQMGWPPRLSYQMLNRELMIQDPVKLKPFPQLKSQLSLDKYSRSNGHRFAYSESSHVDKFGRLR